MFSYTALSSAGDRVSGELEAANGQEVIERLLLKQLLPIGAVEKSARSARLFTLQWRQRRRLAAKDLALISQQLARLLKAGLSLDRSLSILTRLSSDARTNAVVQATLDRVRDGASLSEALEQQDGAFPPDYVSIVRAGEAGGALQTVLDRTAEFLVRSEAVRQRVVSAMIYPALLSCAAVISVVIVLTVVLPQFEPVFQEAGSKLPESTRVLMSVGAVVRTYWWCGPLAAMAIAIGWQRAMRKPWLALARDRLVLRMPLLKILILRFEISRFCRTLGTLLANGVSAPTALGLCGRTIGNRLLSAAVADAALRFVEGEGLSNPLSGTGYFPDLAVQLVRIGEETGRLESMLIEVADIYDQDVQRMVDRLLALIVPGITILMGVAIAAIVASVMSALISINDLAV